MAEVSRILKELSSIKTLGYIDTLNYLCDTLSSNKDIKIIGLAAGRMSYSLRAFIMRLNHMGYNASMIGDTNVPRCDSKTLIIVNSSTGETSSILLFAQQAKKAGSKIICITTNKKSSIAKLADKIIEYDKINSFQLMKTAYEQYTYLLFDSLVIHLCRKLNLDILKIQENHSILE